MCNLSDVLTSYQSAYIRVGAWHLFFLQKGEIVLTHIDWLSLFI